MFIIAINLWFKFSGKIFANIYSITACSFFIIGWIRWSSSSGVALWCLVPHISSASCSLVLAAALHRNSVTSSPVYYRWSDRYRFYLCQKALTLGSSHVMNLSLHQTAWYGVILQKWYRHWHVTGKNRNIKAAVQWLENKMSLIHHPEKSHLKQTSWKASTVVLFQLRTMRKVSVHEGESICHLSRLDGNMKGRTAS